MNAPLTTQDAGSKVLNSGALAMIRRPCSWAQLVKDSAGHDVIRVGVSVTGRPPHYPGLLAETGDAVGLDAIVEAVKEAVKVLDPVAVESFEAAEVVLMLGGDGRVRATYDIVEIRVCCSCGCAADEWSEYLSENHRTGELVCARCDADVTREARAESDTRTDYDRRRATR